jgi:hypothetical protein
MTAKGKPAMLDPASPTLGGCRCALCTRAASLDAMARVDAARASASRVPVVADPWADDDDLRAAKGVTTGLGLSGLAWLALAIVAAWAWAWLAS